MPERLIFFMDDFGTRTICKAADTPPMRANEFSFGLGGLLVDAIHVAEISASVRNFCARWEVPELHGNKIRAGKGKFSFVKSDEKKKERFLNELETLMLDRRIIPHACVICRPGYRDRYVEKHPNATRWEMSRTAFDISVERAAKLAREKGCILDIVYERTGKKEDRLIEQYFEDLSGVGMGFDSSNSKKYAPLQRSELTETLNKIRPDGKSNSMLQLADLVLHPLCHITSGRPNRAHEAMHANKMIIDYHSEDMHIAVKYSCYDGEHESWKHTINIQERGPKDPQLAVGV